MTTTPTTTTGWLAGCGDAAARQPFAFDGFTHKRIMAYAHSAEERELKQASPATAIPAAAPAKEQQDDDNAAPSPYYFARGLRKVHPYKCEQLHQPARRSRSSALFAILMYGSPPMPIPRTVLPLPPPSSCLDFYPRDFLLFHNPRRKAQSYVPDLRKGALARTGDSRSLHHRVPVGER